MKRVLTTALVAAVLMVVAATLLGAVRLGPLTVLALHRTADADSTTVALRPGAGAWLVVAVFGAWIVVAKRLGQ